MADSGRELYKDDMLKLFSLLDSTLETYKSYPEFCNRLHIKGKYDIVLVGGAVMVLRFGSRETSRDIDAVYNSDAWMQKAIKEVADGYEIKTAWINNDFMKAPSFTPLIIGTSEFMREYRNIRLHQANIELMLCMKLIAFRAHRKDKQDCADAEYLVQVLTRMGNVVNSAFIVYLFKKYYTNKLPKLNKYALNFVEGLDEEW